MHTEGGIAWHDGTILQQAVERFSAAHANVPQDSMCKGKQHLQPYLDEMMAVMKVRGVGYRMEYMGSSYEGVKVARHSGDVDLEFDIMVIKPDGELLTATPIQGHPRFAMLKPKLGQRNSAMFAGKTSSAGYLSPRMVTSEFRGTLQKFVNETRELKRISATLHDHGPAIQMDIAKPGGVKMSVDLVPTYEVNGDVYVAKPHGNQPHVDAWMKSFNLKEKAKFHGMDTDNGCRKQTLRCLKVIRNRAPELASLTTYHLKMALFHSVDRIFDASSWGPKQSGKRIMDVLKFVEEALTNNNLPHYFMPDFNLLADIPTTAAVDMRNRIKRLRTNEAEFMSIISV